jgi:hypothetical protein
MSNFLAHSARHSLFLFDALQVDYMRESLLGKVFDRYSAALALL